MTDKYATNDDLYGSRGETLSALIGSAESVEIVSRSRSAVNNEQTSMEKRKPTKNQTKSHFFNHGTKPVDENSAVVEKIFRKGKLQKSGESRRRKLEGTSIVVRRIYSSLPVRSRSMRKHQEIHTLLCKVEAISMLHPFVRFTVKSCGSEAPLILLEPENDTLSRFRQIYGTPNITELEPFEEEFDLKMCLRGIFALSSNGKTIRHYFTNGRPCTSCQLSRVMENVLGKRHMRKRSLESGFSKVKLTSICVLEVIYDESDFYVDHLGDSQEVYFAHKSLLSKALYKVFDSLLTRHIEILKYASCDTKSANVDTSSSASAAIYPNIEVQEASSVSADSVSTVCSNQTIANPAASTETEAEILDAYFATPLINAQNQYTHSGMQLNPRKACKRLAFEESECQGMERMSKYFKSESDTAKNPPFQHKMAPKASRSFYSPDNYRFSLKRESFEKLTVLGQLDYKFIICKGVFCFPSATGDTEEILPAVIVVDQHAADERIRVEQMEKKLSEQLDKGVNKDEHFILHSAKLKEPKKKLLSSSDHSSAHDYVEVFKYWGWHWIQGAQLYDSREIFITHVPVLAGEECSDEDFFDFLRKLQELNPARGIERQIVSYRYTPQFIKRVLNGKACRGAIMFGDELSYPDMCSLIYQLHECRLPFQCAHGRPSIYPLLVLPQKET